MATIHMSEAEVARDLHAALAKVQKGIEVVIERDHRPVAVLTAPPPSVVGRKLTDCIALLREREKVYGAATIDEDFAADVQAAIDAHREPIRNPWDD